jgi:hypothetical protein
MAISSGTREIRPTRGRIKVVYFALLLLRCRMGHSLDRQKQAGKITYETMRSRSRVARDGVR